MPYYAQRRILKKAKQETAHNLTISELRIWLNQTLADPKFHWLSISDPVGGGSVTIENCETKFVGKHSCE